MADVNPFYFYFYADMAELADAPDSGSGERLAHAGSSPVIRIVFCTNFRGFPFFVSTLCQLFDKNG